MTAILEISDGITTVNLLNAGNPGFHLDFWRPSIAQAKGGGTFQSSSLSSFSRLVNRQFDNVTEIFRLKVSGYGQDALIREVQDLLRLLEKATAYWLTDWSNVTISGTLQDAPVWIKAQATCETSPRYALIRFYQFADLDNPYGQPFFGVGDISVMDRLQLAIQRGHWLTNQPGTDTCVQVSSQQAWENRQPWSVLSTDPTGAVIVINADSGNDLFAADQVNAVLKSTDNGVNWASSLADAGLRSILVLANDNVLAGSTTGAAEVQMTTDGGTIWNVEDTTNATFAFIQLTNGDVLAFGLAGTTTAVRRSTDNGDNWAALSTINNGGPSGILSATQLTNGDVLLAGIGGGWRSSDNGTTWTKIDYSGSLFAPNATNSTFYQHSNGNLFTTGNDGSNVNILLSEDNGASWRVVATSITSSVITFITDERGVLYAHAGIDIYRSEDNGETWVIDSTTPSGGGALIRLSDDTLLAGDSSQVLSFANGDFPVTLGGEAACPNIVRISNKEVFANLTHIKIDDGGVFSDIFPITSFPQDISPTIPATNDAIYFGIETTGVNTGIFDSLVFDIGDPNPGINTLTWEYWNGSWTTLIVYDNTSGGTVYAFTKTGVNSVHWTPPTDWATTAVDSITGYWVRARFSNPTVAFTDAITQVNRDIYTITRNRVDIDSAQVLGDISSLSRIQVVNQSAFGPQPSLRLWANRVIVGLRSSSRGSDFRSFINVSDEQNIPGISISLGTNVSYSNDTQAPTGRLATYNPAGVEAMADRVTITFDQNTIRQFYGTFHLFLRVQRTTGASTDFTIQAIITTGSGGLSFTTETQQVQGTTAYELIDFGRITIPASDILNLSELGDSSTITIQASAASGTPNLEIYDIILIPVDEWAGDFVDQANTDDSMLGYGILPVDNIKRLLDIDSITTPRAGITAKLRRIDGPIVAIYNSITPGECILQANEDQEYHFLTASTSATGTDFQWIANPWVSHSIDLSGNNRYLGMKADR